jgi:multisubunit Na+/H+ antiporter MnhB subunit
MNSNENAVIVVAARWITPLAALFAFTLLANWPAGTGVGLVAGLALALAIVLNALIFGVRSVLMAAPPFVLRAALMLAVIVAFAGVGLPDLPWSAQFVEFGAFAATASGVTLISLAIMGRAGALRDATW